MGEPLGPSPPAAATIVPDLRACGGNLLKQRESALHVVESFGGGVADAILALARSTPDLDHHLLYAARREAPVEPSLITEFASANPLVQGHLRRIAQVRRTVNALSPSVLHAHSSFGGGYARLAVSRRRVPIVYTPHCFAFERRDIGHAKRAAYRGVERVLSWNTSAVAACSPREATLALELNGAIRATYVPNVAQVSEVEPVLCDRPERFVIVGAGRVTAQKDTSTFAAIARAFKSEPSTAFCWVGGGEQELEDELRDAGVSVTGWLTKAEVLGRVSSADLYLHTAAWEGFPVGLLEAVAVDVPALVIDKPYAGGLAPAMVARDADDAVVNIRQFIADASQARALLEAGRRSFRENTVESQAAALRHAYTLALDREASE